MSRIVITGKRIANGVPLFGSVEPGPELPRHEPSTFAQTMKWRAGSIGLPAPTIRVHQPALPVIGWVEATCWSPVSAWQIRIAFDASASSVP